MFFPLSLAPSENWIRYCAGKGGRLKPSAVFIQMSSGRLTQQIWNFSIALQSVVIWGNLRQLVSVKPFDHPAAGEALGTLLANLRFTKKIQLAQHNRQHRYASDQSSRCCGFKPSQGSSFLIHNWPKLVHDLLSRCQSTTCTDTSTQKATVTEWQASLY